MQVLMGGSERTKVLGKPRSRWEGNIKVDIRKWERIIYWILVVGHRLTRMKGAMNLWVLYQAGYILKLRNP
jgi:hypothetical protein